MKIVLLALFAVLAVINNSIAFELNKQKLADKLCQKLDRICLPSNRSCYMPCVDGEVNQTTMCCEDGQVCSSTGAACGPKERTINLLLQIAYFFTNLAAQFLGAGKGSFIAPQSPPQLPAIVINLPTTAPSTTDPPTTDPPTTIPTTSA